MSAAILVLNCGSSSLKYRLFETPSEALLAEGIIERIGEPAPHHRHLRYRGAEVMSRMERDVVAPTHREAFAHMRAALDGAVHDLVAIGHRVVHGGERFHQAVRIDTKVERDIEALAVLAPLHNPANLLGIRLAAESWPGLPQVAAFDTAFHHSLPPLAHRYAVPEAWYHLYQVRRYGFHGLSHEYVAQRAAAHLDRPLAALNLITLHLGNGASACAIRGGRSVDTSMGFTPLEGLVMGTRSGDLDPALPLHMERVTGMGWHALDHVLNHECGLKGMTGLNDMREILARVAAGDEAARLALEVYAYRVRKYIGAYFAVLGRVDAVVFTAGVGENAAPVRAAACAGLQGLGIVLDEAANARATGEVAAIGRPDAPVALLVIRTNEELHIARQVRALLGAD
ncbi:acetate/propionate family kinase [Thiobacter aerophilum]|uniref:Acetate kinase n=1 Tax=Thiobacter aerophilum TaxID=3121275 RepID=A0ABV0EGA5_9BURK